MDKDAMRERFQETRRAIQEELGAKTFSEQEVDELISATKSESNSGSDS
jgi:hypothetical protein